MKLITILISLFIIGCGSKESKEQNSEVDYLLPSSGEYRELEASEGDYLRVKFPKYKEGIQNGYGKVFDFYRRDIDAGFSINEIIKNAFYSFSKIEIKDTKWPTKESCEKDIKCNEFIDESTPGFRSYIDDKSGMYMSFLERTFFFDVYSDHDNFTTKFALKIECMTLLEERNNYLYCKDDQYKIKLKIFEFKEL